MKTTIQKEDIPEMIMKARRCKGSTYEGVWPEKKMNLTFAILFTVISIIILGTLILVSVS